MLPFLYIAWADGMLTDAEITDLRGRLTAAVWLTPEDKAVLQGWLDPANPPSATTYFGWVRTLRQAATHPDTAARTLSELGQAVATPGVVLDEEARALAELEALLGVLGGEAVRDLTPRPTAADALPVAPESFDVQALKHVIDGSHHALRDRVREILSEPAFAYPPPGLELNATRDLVLAWAQRLADEGIGALAFPAFAGGHDSIAEFIAAFETIGFHDLSLVVKYGVQFGLWGGSVNQLGTARHKERYLADTGTLALPGAFAMTERRHGSNVRDLQTVARLDRATDEWVITTPTEHDHKEWIGNAGRHGRIASVFAQLEIDGESYGVHAFVVPIRAADGTPMPGVRIEDSGHKMGLDGVDNGRLWFDDVRIPRPDLLDRFATVSADGLYESPIPSASKRFFVMLGTLVGGRIAVGSAANSAAKAGLTIAVRYGARRRQFGPAGEAEVPLLDYLTHQRRLLPYVATSIGLSFALHDLTEQFSALAPGSDTREIEAAAASLKAMASWHCTRALQQAREACGGEGYRWSNRIAQRKADSDIFTTFEGDNTVLMLQVAKGLLAGYRAEFSDLNLFGMLRYIREVASVKLGEVNPIARSTTTAEHLLDPAWHAEMFERRERMLLVQAAARLKRRLDEGMDSFEAFVQVQDHLLALGRAHAERRVLTAFQRAVESTEAPDLQAVLRGQCALFALAHLETDRGWFLEQNLFDAPVAKAVRHEVNALLARVRPIAVELVDAFGIPDAILGSEIGRAFPS